VPIAVLEHSVILPVKSATVALLVNLPLLEVQKRLVLIAQEDFTKTNQHWTLVKVVMPVNTKIKPPNRFVCHAAQEPIKTSLANSSAPIVLLGDRMQTVKVRLTVPNVTLENIPTKRENLLVNHVQKVHGVMLLVCSWNPIVKNVWQDGTPVRKVSHVRTIATNVRPERKIQTKVLL
jgi:hypothetical protein